MNPHDIFAQLITGSVATATAEAGVRVLLREAESARIAWEAAGSPATSPLHDAYAAAVDEFRAAVVYHVEGVELMRGVNAVWQAYINQHK